MSNDAREYVANQTDIELADMLDRNLSNRLRHLALQEQERRTIELHGPDWDLCGETCAPHLHQHCSPDCEADCGCGGVA